MKNTFNICFCFYFIYLYIFINWQFPPFFLFLAANWCTGHCFSEPALSSLLLRFATAICIRNSLPSILLHRCLPLHYLRADSLSENGGFHEKRCLQCRIGARQRVSEEAEARRSRPCRIRRRGHPRMADGPRRRLHCRAHEPPRSVHRYRRQGQVRR